MPTPPTPADLPNHPGPPQDQAATQSASPPTRSAHLLTLIRKLFDYGNSLVSALQQRPPFAPPHLAGLAQQFGTPNLHLIAAHIMRGLHTILALKARLIRDAVRLDRAPALAVPRLRHPRPPAPRDGAARQPRPGSRAAEAALLDHPPTPEEIAARIRCLPIGIVIAGICDDLGITLAHPLWGELFQAVTHNGGQPTQPLRAQLRRLLRGPREFARAAGAQLAAAVLPGLTPAAAPIAAATGPP